MYVLLKNPDPIYFKILVVVYTLSPYGIFFQFFVESNQDAKNGL